MRLRPGVRGTPSFFTPSSPGCQGGAGNRSAAARLGPRPQARAVAGGGLSTMASGTVMLRPPPRASRCRSLDSPASRSGAAAPGPWHRSNPTQKAARRRSLRQTRVEERPRRRAEGHTRPRHDDGHGGMPSCPQRANRKHTDRQPHAETQRPRANTTFMLARNSVRVWAHCNPFACHIPMATEQPFEVTTPRGVQGPGVPEWAPVLSAEQHGAGRAVAIVVERGLGELADMCWIQRSWARALAQARTRKRIVVVHIAWASAEPGVSNLHETEQRCFRIPRSRLHLRPRSPA